MNSHGNENGAITLIERYDKPAAVELASFDGERNLSINCAELRYLRRYLILVGQWYPKEWNSTKRAFYHIWQVENTNLNILNCLK
jgi:hypothetical protein